MSIEYFVYSADPRPITVEELTADLARQGWAAVVTHGYLGSADYAVDGRGPLGHDCGVYACRTQDAKGADAASAVHGADADAVKQFLRDGVLGAIGVEADIPYDAATDAADADLVAAMTGHFGPEYVRFRLAAAVRYGTRTSSGRTDVGYDLHVAATKSIARLRGGMFENEIDGEHQMIRPGEEPTSNW